MAKRRRDLSRLGGGLFVGAVALAVLTVYVAVQKPPNLLATGLLQAITLIFSTAGSIFLTLASAKSAADDSLRRHARSAFRRMRNLYEALGRLRTEIDRQSVRLAGLGTGSTSRVDYEHVRAGFVALDQLVTEQIATADDALEDWRDIVPEEVQEIQEQARKRAERDQDDK
ncbi:hypothetical protein ABZU42_12670 [Micromonospora profundi]|uniref:hypothetical protein n=1 Tax=Micromonospora profundi TaxID=1420889 RepID=UPI0033AE822B